MKTALYATLSATPYVNPPKPPDTPPLDPSQLYIDVQRHQIRDNHTLQVKTFQEHNNVDTALQQLHTQAIDVLCLSEKWNRFTEYLGVSTRGLLGHLLGR